MLDNMLDKKIPMLALFFLFFLFFLGGCEVESKAKVSPDQGKTSLSLRQGKDIFGSFQFSIESFIKDDQVIFEGAKLLEQKVGRYWQSVTVHWGFRTKGGGVTYWVQKSHNYDNPSDKTAYAMQASEAHKDKFVPEALPAALLQQSELQVVARLNVGQFEINAALDLPPDFKTQLLKVTNIYGRIQSQSAHNVASVFVVHKSSGEMYQSYSDTNGNYRVVVQNHGEFFLLVLKDGMKPSVQSFSFNKGAVSEIRGKDAVLSASGVSVANNQLYDVSQGSWAGVSAGGLSVAGKTIWAKDSTPLPHATLLFYNRASKKLYFLRSDEKGAFSLNLPMDAAIQDGDLSPLMLAPRAYGHSFGKGTLTLGQEEPISKQLQSLAFTLEPNFKAAPQLSWGRQSSGGPSGFVGRNAQQIENEAVRYGFSGSSPTVQLDLKLFDPLDLEGASPKILWKHNGRLVRGQTGLRESFALSSPGRHTITAEVENIRAKSSITRQFFLDASHTGKPTDPAVKLEYQVQNGRVLSSSPSVVQIEQSGATAVVLKLASEAVDPSTGTSAGLKKEWFIDGVKASPKDPDKPSFTLSAGRQELRLQVSNAKDSRSVSTVSKVYIVSSALSSRSPTVRLGRGSSGGVLSSGLGTPSNPLRYPVAGSGDRFKVTVKPLVSDPVGGRLDYSWSIVPADGVSRSTSKEDFELGVGTHSISVTVKNADGLFATVSRTYRIVSGWSLPSGYSAAWGSQSSGGVGAVAAGDPKTTFGHDGRNPVSLKLEAELKRASVPLPKVEWYVDRELQEAKGNALESFALSGAAGRAVQRTVQAIGHDVNGQVLQLKRVFTLKPRLARPSISQFAPSVNSIRVSWNRVANANGYTLYYSSSLNFATGAASSVDITGGQIVTKNIGGLNQNTVYYFRLLAKAGSSTVYLNSQESPERSSRTATPQPLPQLSTPILRSIQKTTRSSGRHKLQVDWLHVPHRSSYDILYRVDGGFWHTFNTPIASFNYYGSSNTTVDIKITAKASGYRISNELLISYRL